MSDESKRDIFMLLLELWYTKGLTEAVESPERLLALDEGRVRIIRAYDEAP